MSIFNDSCTPAEKGLRVPSGLMEYIECAAISIGILTVTAFAFVLVEKIERIERMAEIVDMATQTIRTGKPQCTVQVVESVRVEHCVTLREAK